MPQGDGEREPAMRADFTVFARDYPETALVVEIKADVGPVRETDAAVRQLARSMWGANCHYGLIITPTNSYVLRDDFRTGGPDSIRIANTLPTRTLLSRVAPSDSGLWSEERLHLLVGKWLERLIASYEEALPDDPGVLQALFPDVVGAVAGGRIVAEASV